MDCYRSAWLHKFAENHKNWQAQQDNASVVLPDKHRINNHLTPERWHSHCQMAAKRPKIFCYHLVKAVHSTARQLSLSDDDHLSMMIHTVVKRLVIFCHHPIKSKAFSSTA